MTEFLNWCSKVNFVFNSTVVNSLNNLEETIVSPGGIPAVGNQPILDSIFSTPSKELNGVSTKSTASGVLVNTGLVCQEILIDCESSLNGSVVKDLLHNVVLSRSTASLFALVSLLGISPSFSVLAGFLASGGLVFSGRARVVGVGDVVVA